MTINTSYLSGNSASTDGGAIYNRGALALSNSTVAYNSASSGGGIFNLNSGVMDQIQNTILTGNTSSTYGGGIANAGNLTVSICTLSDNSASSGGGGVYNSGTVTIGGCTLSNDSASLGGAYLQRPNCKRDAQRQHFVG